MRLSEELARILPSGGRRKRRPPGKAPREIVPAERREQQDPFDAARRRLKGSIPPREG